MAELQGLEFKITADSASASDKLDKLASAMERVKNASRGRLGLSSASKAVTTLNDSTKTLDTDKLVRLATALERLGNAGKITISKNIATRLSDINQAASAISTTSIGNIRNLASALQQLQSVGNINVPNFNGVRLPNNQNPAQQPAAPATPQQAVPQNSAFTNAAPPPNTVPIINSIGNALAGARQHGLAFLTTLRDITAQLQSLGQSGIGSIAAQLASIPRRMAMLPAMLGQRFAAQVRQTTSSLGGLLNSLKRIAMYRLVRGAISAITKGLTEGLQNLYQWSNIAGTSFASNMDRIATASNYVKNSFAAMVSPLIESLSPALDFIADKIVTVFNLINQLFARLAGKSTYTAAKKISTTWKEAATSAGKSASDAASNAADELKRTILAFDELNVLNDNNKSSGGSGGGGGGGGGGGSSGGDLFEELPIDGAISNFADMLKDAFQNADWERLGRLLGSKFNEIVDSIPWADLGTKVGKGLDGIIKTAYYFLDEADFENLGKNIATFFNNALKEVDFEFVGRLLVKGVTSGIDFLIGFLRELNWGQVTSKLSDGIIGVFNETTEWLKSYNWKELGTEFYNKVKDAVSNIKFAEIASSFFSMLGTALRSAYDFLSGIFDGLATDLKKWWDSEIKADTVEEMGANLLKAILKGIGSIADFVKTNILDPFMNNLVGEDKWVEMKQAGKDLINNIKKGIQELLSNPVTWVQENIIAPIQRGLDGSEPLEFHTGPAEEDSSSWLSTIAAFWKKVFYGDDHNLQKIPTTPDDDTSSWTTKIKGAWEKFKSLIGLSTFDDAPKADTSVYKASIFDAWNRLFGGGKNKQSFDSEPGNSSSTWLTNVKSWWDSKFGNGKNTQQFDVEGNAKSLKDSIPDSDRKVSTVANFRTTDKTGLTKIGKTINTIAKFKEGVSALTKSGKTVNTIAKFKQGLSALTRSGKTINTISKFKEGFSALTRSGKTVNTIAKFKDGYSALGRSDKTLGTIAKFKDGYSALSSSAKTLNTIANFKDSHDALSHRPSLNVKAYFTGVAGQSKTYTLKAKPQFAAKGGVFTASGERMPITRYASGGSPGGGQMFIAREAGPELVGTLGGNTAVMNNDQIVASVSHGVARAIAGIHFRLTGMPKATPLTCDALEAITSGARGRITDDDITERRELIDAMNRQNELLRRQNELLQDIADKDTTVEVTASSFTKAASRKNRRDGKTIIPVGT